MTPGVTNQKADGGVGAASSRDKVLVIIGPALQGPQDAPTSVTRRSDLTDTFGPQGPLVEAASYMIDIGIPVVCVRSAASTLAAIGTITGTNLGTSAITAGAAKPADGYDVKLIWDAGGTIGVAGIVYRYSRDGGRSFSAPQALGTATSIMLPGNIQLALGAGTILAGQTTVFTTTAPKSTSTDLVASLAAVYAYGGSWLRALVLVEADATIIAQLDTWAKSFWPQGKNPEVITNTRPRDVVSASAETRSAYTTALTAIATAVQTTEVACCADQCEVLSSISGLRLRKPFAIGFAARTMIIDDSESAAAPADGALPGIFLTTAEGVALYHDEMVFPGLDALGFTCARTFRSRPGAYVNIPRVMSGAASDYNQFQLSAIVNRVIEAAFPLLENKLSKGLLLADGGTIRPDTKKAIEDACNADLRARFVDTRRVSNLRLILSATDNVQLTNTISFSIPTQPLGFPLFFKGYTGLVRNVPAVAA